MKLTVPLLTLIAACMIPACAVSAQMPASEQPAAGQMEQHVHTPAPASSSLALTVNGKTTTIYAADLKAMEQKAFTVYNEHLKTDEMYSGVPLSVLLAKYGLPVDKTTHRTMLRSYIVAEGTDKYWVLYSVTEIEPTEHKGEVIVATSLGGKPLGEDGQFKLVDSSDKKPERWVRNLSAITVKTAE